ncbi:hypothetical protein AVEN_146588-1 [Araneus ventricosus]|uniref:Uncharacterized protein n=1 Tax=Araneus ventricosus TaxID=182803 RepID=A0A4Y2GC95_ARAVE|nr:hypothetical protein AVEN_146588-1 [Araneus ventricosus]
MACFVVISVREQRTTSSTLGEASQSYCPISCLSSIRVGFVNVPPGQLLCLWRTWHTSSPCHQVPPHAFLPPRVSSRSTHRSLDEINTNHRLLTNKIIDLLNLITSHEDLLKSEQPE